MTSLLRLKKDSMRPTFTAASSTMKSPQTMKTNENNEVFKTNENNEILSLEWEIAGFATYTAPQVFCGDSDGRFHKNRLNNYFI